MPSFGCTIVTRNDNYGKNLNQRAAYAINSCIETYDQVVIVDYNSRNLSLVREIEGALLHTGKLKCYIVTPDQHKEFTKNFSNPQPCSEVLGRNIGIRRLTTDFIVSTNVDEVNPPRRYLESITDKDKMITVARHGISLDEVQSTCTPTRIGSGREVFISQLYPQSWPFKVLPEDDWSLIAWPGDLQLAHRDLWYEIKGFEEWQLGVGFNDSYVQRKVMEIGKRVDVSYDIPIYHIDHGKGNDYGESGVLNDHTCLSRPFPGILNDDNWGFPNTEFKEFTL